MRILVLALLLAAFLARTQSQTVGAGAPVGVTLITDPTEYSDLSTDDLYEELEVSLIGEPEEEGGPDSGPDAGAQTPMPMPMPAPGAGAPGPPGPHAEPQNNDVDGIEDDNTLQDDALASSVSLVVAPSSLDDTCPGAKPTSKPAQVKQTKKQRIKVVFVVVLPTNNTVAPSVSPNAAEAFDKTHLVAALRRASRAMGAQHDFDVKVNAVEYIQTQSTKRRRKLHQAPPTSPAIRVTGEAEFAGQDEMVASEILQLLTDAPETIFPESEFGPVSVPDATLTENDIHDDKWILPVVGTLTALATVSAVSTAVFFCRKRVNDETDTYGFIPSTTFSPDAKHPLDRSRSLLSLPSNNAYNNYHDDGTHQSNKEYQYNNVGYYLK